MMGGWSVKRVTGVGGEFIAEQKLLKVRLFLEGPDVVLGFIRWDLALVLP